MTKPKSRKVLRQGHSFPPPNFSDCPSRPASREEENKDKAKDKDKCEDKDKDKDKYKDKDNHKDKDKDNHKDKDKDKATFFQIVQVGREEENITFIRGQTIFLNKL